MSEDKVLGKLDFLKARPLRKRLVPVPEWGGSVWVQEMTAGARDEFDTWVMTHQKEPGLRFRILIATVVDENGELLFSDLDIPDLVKKSSAIIHRLSEIGARLSGIGEALLDEMEKNSEPAQNASLPSGFVENSEEATQTV